MTRSSKLNISLVLIVILLYAFFRREVYAQSNIKIAGRVYDAENGNPLPGAVVRIRNTFSGASVREDGSFEIENINEGRYDLAVSMLGYKTAVVENFPVYPDHTARLEIALRPIPLSGDSVFVYSDRFISDFSDDGEKTIITSGEIRKSKNMGLARILTRVAGVQVQSASGAGNRTTIQIHGSRSNQVLVLLDGQRLNNPQTGEVDLSIIPVDQIERIEVTRQGNSAAYGSNAFEGVISFQTKSTAESGSAEIGSSAGSFSSYSGHLSVENHFGSIGVLGQYSQDYSHQNYQYEYEGDLKTRENSWYRNKKIFGKMYFDSPRHRLSLLYNFHNGNRGLPSSYFDEQATFSASLKENFHSIQLQDRWIVTGKLYFTNSLSYNNLNQIYDNHDVPARYRKTRYHTEQTNEMIEGKVEGKYVISSSIESYSGATYLREELDQTNLLAPAFSIGRKVRDSYSWYSGFLYRIPRLLPGLIQSFQIRGSLRVQKVFQNPVHTYPFLGASIVPSFLTQIHFSANWAKAVRYPDFNSLFWKGDARARGNPELAPERKQGWTFSAKTHFEENYLPHIEFLYFSNKITDLIYWHRAFDGVWEPRNEATVVKSGWDLQISQQIIPDYFRLNGAYSKVKALNKRNDPLLFNKETVFTPEHTLSLSVLADISIFEFQLFYRYLSERETTISNSRGTQMSSFHVWDSSVGFDYLVGSFAATVFFAVKNITGEDYQLIMGYPMPGRHFDVSIELRFNAK